MYDEDGELVCLKPFPSMPVYFWNDPQGLKYKKAYFSVYNGKFTFSRSVLSKLAGDKNYTCLLEMMSEINKGQVIFPKALRKNYLFFLVSP